MNTTYLEEQLKDFNRGRRNAALQSLMEMVHSGDISLPHSGREVNLHCHTFYSFNGYGFSPSYFAWKARREGLLMGGVVDFDVLDATDEFLYACKMIGLRGCAGIETRVFVPEFADLEINSPGEPGVSYYMGVGFTTKDTADPVMLEELKTIAQNRNRTVLEKVNPYLSPVELDYEADVLPYTPNGNATERHICMAFDKKARHFFGDEQKTASFWAEKLNTPIEQIEEAMKSPPVLQGLIRAKTMKAGGPGYIKAVGSDFPQLDRVSKFVSDAGAIPTHTFLDGTSDGESQMEKLLDTVMAAGSAAVNIIPDRNWNIKDEKVRKQKVELMDKFIAMSCERALPIAVGTEMNAHGQRFVDNFEVPEMQKHVEVFLHGAFIFYAHTILQSQDGMGYLSDWAKAYFDDTQKKNDFYAQIGECVLPDHLDGLSGISREMEPVDVLNQVSSKH